LNQTGNWNSFFYDKIVFSKTKAALGGNVRFMITGSAPIKKEVQVFM